LFRQIQENIQNLYYEQRITPVIIIDEIHMAPNTILDDLRLIFNFKMDSANPFVLILAGQPQIRNKLSLNTSAPLRQRITMRYQMQGLTGIETKEYLVSRMEIGGYKKKIFTESAFNAIYSATGGILRAINNIAVQCLIYSASNKLDVIDEEVVYQANIEAGI
jgi:type II secretory pathway predicted ATPase ExeA